MVYPTNKLYSDCGLFNVWFQLNIPWPQCKDLLACHDTYLVKQVSIISQMLAIVQCKKYNNKLQLHVCNQVVRLVLNCWWIFSYNRTKTDAEYIHKNNNNKCNLPVKRYLPQLNTCDLALTLNHRRIVYSKNN